MSQLRFKSSSNRLIDALGKLQLQLNIYYNHFTAASQIKINKREERWAWTVNDRYIANRSMDDFINLRYSRRVQFENFNASRTSNLYTKMVRKQSADTSNPTLRANKVLPRLEHNKESRHHQRRINVSTDIKRSTDPEVATIQHSFKREKLNLTRFSMSREREEPPQRFAACTRQGRRNYNEDRFICKVRNSSVYEQKNIFAHKREPYDLYAVFDGHGGASCAEFLKEHFPLLLSRSRHVDSHPEQALKETFEKCEQRFLDLCQAKSGAETSGSCAVVCMVVGARIFVANLGDSRALMLGGGVALQLTRDHKPHEVAEKMRILKHGGKIYRQQEGSLNQIKLFRQMRVLPGNLNVTRTIGDAETKLRKYGGLPGMISAVPDISSFEKLHYEVLLLGSDGLFEAFGSQEIKSIYEEIASEHEGVSREKWLRLFVETLCGQAQEKSSDNITVIAVLLN